METHEDDRLEQLLREFGDKATVRTVFGEPVRVGEVTVVPVAQVRWRAGRGRWIGPRLGRGGPPPTEPAEPLTGEEGGAPSMRRRRPWGAGGTGGQLEVRPLAVLEIGPNGTRVRSIVDTTTWLLGMFALIGWNVFWITRTIRAILGRRRRSYETIDAG